jgi:hypothetical protein
MSNISNLRGAWAQNYRAAAKNRDFYAAAEAVKDHLKSDVYADFSDTARHPAKIAKLVVGLTDQLLNENKTGLRRQKVGGPVERQRVASNLLNEFINATSSNVIMREPVHGRVLSACAMLPNDKAENIRRHLQDHVSSGIPL